MWGVCLYTYMCIWGSCERKKVALDSLKLELKVIMSHPMWTLVFWKSPRPSSLLSHFSSFQFFTVAIVFKSILFHMRMFFSSFFVVTICLTCLFPCFTCGQLILFKFWCTPSLGRSTPSWWDSQQQSRFTLGTHWALDYLQSMAQKLQTAVWVTLKAAKLEGLDPVWIMTST